MTMEVRLEIAASFLTPQKSPGRGDFHSIREEHLRALAKENDCSLSETMIECLRRDIWPERFRQQRGTYSNLDQIRLLDSRVAIIGAGGLGGAVSLLLARTGVGTLNICDGDGFDESNLNRQWLSNISRLGMNKTRCASEEIERINPVVKVNPFPCWADPDNLPEILDGCALVVDCLDNLPARYMVEDAARQAKIPFIHGAVAGLEGTVMTVFPEDPGLRSLYGPEPAPKKEGAESVLGVPTVIPSALATLQACEVVNLLLNRPSLARKKMLYLDLSVPAIDLNIVA